MLSTEQTQLLADMLSLASQLVKQGGQIIADDFKLLGKNIEIKSDNSYVTATDKKVEQLYRDKIQQKYPDHAIFGEELGGSIEPDKYTWIIDPLDGTTNFVSGIPIFCSMISVYYQGRTVLATVYDPNRDILYAAAEGQGTSINGREFPLPSELAELKKVTLVVDCGRGVGIQEKMFDFLQKHGPKFRSTRKFGCMLSGLSIASSGMLNVLILFGIDVYDLNCTSHILGQAGYKIIIIEDQNQPIATQKDMIVCTPQLEKPVMALFDQMKLKYQ